MFHPCSTLPHLLMPGIDGMGWFLSPSCTKMGRMKWAGDSQFSRMPWRKVALRRLRRGLEGRSCLMQERVGGVGGGVTGWGWWRGQWGIVRRGERQPAAWSWRVGLASDMHECLAVSDSRHFAVQCFWQGMQCIQMLTARTDVTA